MIPHPSKKGGAAGRHAIDLLLKSFLSNTRVGVYRYKVDDTLIGFGDLGRLPVDKNMHQ